MQKRPIENLRPAKKLPLSPSKKQAREEPAKRPATAMAVPAKGVKHALEVEDNKPRAVNYNGAGKPTGSSQQGQDVKRRRTDEAEDKEILTSKPMRVSVVKQVLLLHSFSYIRTSNLQNPLENPYVSHTPQSPKGLSRYHQLINMSILPRVLWLQQKV